jgi:hypothetical protein
MKRAIPSSFGPAQLNDEGAVSRSAKGIEVTSRARAVTFDLSNEANRMENHGELV